jgi:nucleotide-binding universal stress UspA family protein
MTTAMQQPHTATYDREAPRPVIDMGPLLVATDGFPESDGAIRAALAIADRTGQDVRVLAVYQPIPIAAMEVQIPMSPRQETQARLTLGMQVEEQVQRVAGDTDWPVQTLTGQPAATIARVSREIGASLIIMGLGGHSWFDRLLGDETVLQVVRLGSGPVLAVAPGFSGLPQRVLAAVDFSAASGRAVMMASELVRSGGRITMANVLPQDVDPANWKAVNTAYRGAVGRAFDRLSADVGFEDDVVVDRKIVAGDPAKELLELATNMKADLVVTGTHGRNFLTRLRLGSVSTKLLREAHCSILIAPHEDAPGYVDELAEERGRFGFYAWSERLEEFTRRNAGRRALLEEIDPEIGAQVQEKGVPFIGASYDPRDGRVQLMFGDEFGTHLTRNIGGITGVQMLRDQKGRDLFLRIAHGRGQTLLTLER